MMGANSCLSILPSDVLMGRCEPSGQAGEGCKGGAVAVGACLGVRNLFRGSHQSWNSKLGTAVASSQCSHGH